MLEQLYRSLHKLPINKLKPHVFKEIFIDRKPICAHTWCGCAYYNDLGLKYTIKNKYDGVWS